MVCAVWKFRRDHFSHPHFAVHFNLKIAYSGSNAHKRDATMRTMSARAAKNAFGLLIDTARAEPVVIEKHGRGVVVVVAIEEYERLAEHTLQFGKNLGRVDGFD